MSSVSFNTRRSKREEKEKRNREREKINGDRRKRELNEFKTNHLNQKGTYREISKGGRVQILESHSPACARP